MRVEVTSWPKGYESFQSAVADVFEPGVLTLTFTDETTKEFQPESWARAVMYGTNGWDEWPQAEFRNDPTVAAQFAAAAGDLRR